tara:strand:- start:2853 stop:4004 length:1152 start_codon:yes stop_codon:yes gene_type:complete
MPLLIFSLSVSLILVKTPLKDFFSRIALSISSDIEESTSSELEGVIKQRDQFGSVLNDLGEGIVVTDSQGNITFKNDQFFQILNLENSLGNNIKDLNIKSLDYLYRRSKKKKRADIEFEIELNDKSTRWVLASINQSKNSKDNILVVTDITQLRSLDSMRRDFISNLSHELRTPVSVIRANSETLLDSALEDKAQAKIFAKAILHNSERLTDMVSSLLDLTRIEYGELKLNFQEIYLDKFFKPFINSMINLSKKKKIDIIYKPNHKGNVNADLQAFERIMNNLIDNAIKYSKEDSQITISTSNEVDNYIKVMIEDSGQGISDEDKDHIFSRFYRTASARAQENQGSGLGLAIVKHLVNSLNGEVGIESKPNKGSIFWFTVPIY